MELDEFRHYLDIYGADLSRWPEPFQASGRHLAEIDDEASALLAEAQRLDQLLDSVPVGPVSDHADSVRRIVGARVGLLEAKRDIRSFRLWHLRTLGALCAVLITIFGVGWFSVSQLATLNGKASDIGHDWLPSVEVLGQLSQAFEQYRTMDADDILLNTPNQFRAQDQRRTTLLARIAELRRQYEPLITSGEERVLAQRMDAAWQDYLAAEPRMIALSRVNNDDAAFMLYQNRLGPIFQEVHSTVSEDMALNGEGGRQASAEGQSVYLTSRSVILAAMILAVAICFLAGLMLPAGRLPRRSVT